MTEAEAWVRSYEADCGAPLQPDERAKALEYIKRRLGKRGEAEYLSPWVSMWAAIGWLAATDIVQTMCFHNFRVMARSLELMKSQQTQLDNILVDIDRLKRKVKG